MTRTLELSYADLDAITRDCPIHPSDISTYAKPIGGCPRKWAFRRIDRVMSDETDPSYVVEGRYGHALIEQHYRPERVIAADAFPSADRSRINTVFADLAPHLPQCADVAQLEIEHHFRLQYARGLWFEGTPDFFDPGWGLICDWKFRDNIRPGTADGRDITTDPQAIVYAWSVFTGHPGLRSVTCVWYWINKPDKKTPTKARRKSHLTTSVGFTRDQCHQAMLDHVIPTAYQMALDRLLYDAASQVPPNPETGCCYGKGYGMQNCNYSLPCDYFDPGISRADRAAQLELI